MSTTPSAPWNSVDPELGVNIADLGLLYSLKYSDNDGALLIDMT